MNLQMVAKYKDLFHQLLLMIKTFARQLLYLPLLCTSLSVAFQPRESGKAPLCKSKCEQGGI